MTSSVGSMIVDILESAGSRYLQDEEPEIYRAFLLQVGGTDALRDYDRSDAYWDRVQSILDGFFTSAQRAEICSRMLRRSELRDRPELREFVHRATAERRVQELVAKATLASRRLPGHRVTRWSRP